MFFGPDENKSNLQKSVKKPSTVGKGIINSNNVLVFFIVR